MHGGQSRLGVAFVWRGRRGHTKLETVRRSRRTWRPQGECAVSVQWSLWSAHRHGLVQLGVLVVCLGLSGLLGARSTAQGSVRRGVSSEGGGSDADHRWRRAARWLVELLVKILRRLQGNSDCSTPRVDLVAALLQTVNEGGVRQQGASVARDDVTMGEQTASLAETCANLGELTPGPTYT